MNVPTAALSSVLLRAEGLRTIAPRGLSPLDPAACRFAGRAVTVRYLPLREDRAAALSPYNEAAPFFDAWEQVREGDVVVIDAAGREDAGILGEMLATRLARLGAAGVVCDGGMRDVVALRGLGLPVFCRGPAPASSTAGLMLVDHGLPVAIGGVTVFPGDMVVADEDGVVICPAASWEKAKAEVAAREAIEAYVRLRVEAGEPVRGLYPPTDAVRAAFARWQAAGSPRDRLA
jgi:regulator of RNase E activity RraA